MILDNWAQGEAKVKPESWSRKIIVNCTKLSTITFEWLQKQAQILMPGQDLLKVMEQYGMLKDVSAKYPLLITFF